MPRLVRIRSSRLSASPSVGSVASAGVDHCAQHRSSLPHNPCLPADVGAWNRDNRREDEQRPQAELKPAAFSLRRLDFGRLSLHGRIVPERGQPEQGILGCTAHVGRTRAAGSAIASRCHPPGHARVGRTGFRSRPQRPDAGVTKNRTLATMSPDSAAITTVAMRYTIPTYAE